MKPLERNDVVARNSTVSRAALKTFSAETRRRCISADLNDLSSGIYLVRFSTNEEVITKKVVVIK